MSEEMNPITREEMLLNGDDLEPITREEKILAGVDDFYVLTRREYFLKKYRGSQIEVVPYEATANGTYTAPQGKAYSPFTVNIADGTNTQY